MLSFVGSSNVNFNPIYGNYLTDNIFFNPIENLTELPKNLSNDLADIWLVLAQKYENNQLSFDESQTVLKNIHFIIEKIKEMDDNSFIYQYFISKISSFTETERNCLTKFFKETINSNFKKSFSEENYYFFYAFKKLFNTLNNGNKDDNDAEQQVVKKLVVELEDYESRLANALFLMPNEVRWSIFCGHPQRAEVCKDINLRKIWKNIEDSTKHIIRNFSEDEFLNSVKKNLKPFKIHNFEDFITDKVKNNEISIDKLNLKDEVLNYINLTGMFPLSELGFDNLPTQFFLRWLGMERCLQIKKINSESYRFCYLITDFNFICPNLEEFELGYIFDSSCIENICLFQNLKTLKLCISKIPVIKQYLEILPKLENLKVLTLESYQSKSFQKCLNEDTPIIECVTELTIEGFEEFSYEKKCLGEFYEMLFTKFPNLRKLKTAGDNEIIERDQKTLTMSGKNGYFFNKFFKKLSNFKEIESLNLNLNDRSIESWRNAFEDSPSIESVTKLTVNASSDLLDKIHYALLSKLPNLRGLKIRGRDNEIIELDQKTLTMSGNNGYLFSNLFKKLSNFKEIENLNLNLNLNGRSIESWCNAFENSPSIESVTKLTVNAPSDLLDEIHDALLSKLPNLRELKIRGDNEIIELDQKTLTMSGNNGYLFSNLFKKLSNFKEIENLNLNLNGRSIKSWRNTFKDSPSIENVTKLTVNAPSDLLDEIHDALLSKLPNLRELETSCTDASLEKIANLKNLKKLNLFDTCGSKEKFTEGVRKLTQITDLSLGFNSNYYYRNYTWDNLPFFILPSNVKHFSVKGNEIPIPSKASLIADIALKAIAREAIKMVFPDFLGGQISRNARIKQLAVALFGGLGIYSWMKSTGVKTITECLPCVPCVPPSISETPALPILSSYEKIGIAAAGVFLTLAVGAAAYYYRIQNSKSKMNAKPESKLTVES